MGVVAGNRLRKKLAQIKQKAQANEIEQKPQHEEDGEKIFIPLEAQEKKTKSKKA